MHRPELRHYLQGILMGCADVIPGVSGGTMALIVGIYERLVESISQGARGVARLLRAQPQAFLEHLRRIEWRLVIPLGLGIGTAILAGARFIPDLIDKYPEPMRALFFGLIAGSIIIPWRRIREHSYRTAAVGAVGAVVAFAFTGLPDRELHDPNLVYVFAAASLAICAMILPGVSGAFLLLVFGIYEASLDAIHDRDLAYVGVFLSGAAIGLMVFSSGLRWLLGRAHDLTMAALVGLMAGSLRALWPYLNDDRGFRAPESGDPHLAVVLLAVAGLAAVVVLDRLGDRADRRGGH